MPNTERIVLDMYYPIFSGMVPLASWIALRCAAAQYSYVVFAKTAISVWCMSVGKSNLRRTDNLKKKLLVLLRFVSGIGV